MLTSALFKLLVLPAVLIAHHYTTSPPVGPPGPNDRVYSWQIFDRCARVVGLICQLFVVFSLICESFLAVSIAFSGPMSPASSGVENTLCPHPRADLTALATVSPLYLLALVIVFVGCIGRLWCYNALGHLFTYEVTLRPSHTLVTHGLYRWVRHPGYTSLFAHLAGMILLHMAPGGWNHECGIMNSMYAWFVGGWFFVIVFSVISLSRRGEVEDSILRAEFGIKWEQYRSAVPYKFVPGVI
ncbi:ICMT-domain-containing protein [Mycena maculata]|uniref:Protein-S-isoprenylcysteine O-methyltransferase n=1 Tax=Mycena maculata TaxID=230809 RepID=A0AAD7JMX2_9AGAR|nr:ICMT-domain-containing protein [Mycena maculata]